MTIIGQNGKLLFGNFINSYKESIRNEQVLTNEVLSRTYPMELKVKLSNDYTLVQKLNFHFCEDLHKDFTEEEYETFKENENWEEDERIFFVK